MARLTRPNARAVALRKKSNHKRSTRPRGRKNMTVEERRQALHADPWTVNVQARSVGCVGCGRTTRLESRGPAEYYMYPWNKHRATCRHIKMAETGTLISEGTEPEAGSKAPTTRRKGQCGRKKASLAAKTARSDTAHTKDTSALEEKDEDRSHCLPSPKCRNVFNWGSYISRDDSRSENQVYLAQRGIRANDRVANYAEQALCEEPTTPSHNISAEWRYVPDGRGEVIKSKKTRGKYTKGIFEPDDAYRQSTGVPLYRFSTAHELQTWFGRSANRKITRKTKIPKNEQEGAQTQNGPCCLLD